MWSWVKIISCLVYSLLCIPMMFGEYEVLSDTETFILKVMLGLAAINSAYTGMQICKKEFLK